MNVILGNHFVIYRDAAKSNRQLAGTKLRNWRNLEPVEDVELSGNYLYQCGNARSDYTTDTFKQLKVTFLHLHFVPNNNFLFYFFRFEGSCSTYLYVSNWTIF
jgi:hypothetical protein